MGLSTLIMVTAHFLTNNLQSYSMKHTMWDKDRLLEQSHNTRVTWDWRANGKVFVRWNWLLQLHMCLVVEERWGLLHDRSLQSITASCDAPMSIYSPCTYVRTYVRTYASTYVRTIHRGVHHVNVYVLLYTHTKWYKRHFNTKYITNKALELVPHPTHLMVRPTRLTNSLYLANRNVLKAEPRSRMRQVAKASNRRQLSFDTCSTLNLSVRTVEGGGERRGRWRGRGEEEGEGGEGEGLWSINRVWYD